MKRDRVLWYVHVGAALSHSAMPTIHNGKNRKQFEILSLCISRLGKIKKLIPIF